MRINRFVTAAFGSVIMAGMAPSAFAGCIGSGGNVAPSTQCSPGMNIHAGSTDAISPVGAYSSTPYGHLQRFEYKNTPNVNIMRVHSRDVSVSLGDHPSQYSDGCTPGSTVYCRANTGAPARVQMNPAPVMRAPMPAPVYQPRPQVSVGSGYNPAAFAPRQYGSTAFVPGIAHIPTSIVDRSPITHIDGVAQPHVNSVTTARSSSHSQFSGRTLVTPPLNAGPMPAPQMRGLRGHYLGSVVTGQQTIQQAGGGSYWERSSGPTIVDGLPATQVLCRRQAPQPAPVNVRVVSPVIGVPYPVPTPRPMMNNGCGPVPYAGAHMGPRPPMPPRPHAAGRWTQ